MKVCMLAYTFYENDNRVMRYAEALAERGDEVDVIALRRPGQRSFEQVQGVNLHRIQKRTVNEGSSWVHLFKLLAFFFRSSLRLTRLHFRKRYQVIHVHSVPDFEVFAALPSRLMGARIILDIHDIVPEFYASKFNVGRQSVVFRALVLVERLSTAFSHHVIIANDIWKERLDRRAKTSSKSTALINYPDTTRFCRDLIPTGDGTGSGERFTMLYPGTLNSHQGLDVALKAVAELQDEEPAPLLLIYGEGGEKNRLVTLAERLGLNGHVVFNDLIPVDEVARVMAEVDVGVVPKRALSFGNEAFSTKIMEFMAMGVPVVASRTRIDTRYFDDSLICFFESDNSRDMAGKLRQMRDDPQRRMEYTRSALEFVSSNNWEVKKTDYFKIVDGLRDRSGKTSQALPAN